VIHNPGYQYGYSSHIDDMKPAVVLYAKNDDDVKAAIAHAKLHGISIALRTGGHQYSGASSTKGTFSFMQVDIFF
jgi:FAD/FMN-containing dehydrogenase